jgi:hypothetical protein
MAPLKPWLVRLPAIAPARAARAGSIERARLASEVASLGGYDKIIRYPYLPTVLDGEAVVAQCAGHRHEAIAEVIDTGFEFPHIAGVRQRDENGERVRVIQIRLLSRVIAVRMMH